MLATAQLHVSTAICLHCRWQADEEPTYSTFEAMLGQGAGSSKLQKAKGRVGIQSDLCRDQSCKLHQFVSRALFVLCCPHGHHNSVAACFSQEINHFHCFKSEHNLSSKSITSNVSNSGYSKQPRPGIQVTLSDITVIRWISSPIQYDMTWTANSIQYILLAGRPFNATL